MKILIAQLNYTVGDLQGNTRKIIHAIEKGRKRKADLVLFSELSICGYPPEDLLVLPEFLSRIDNCLEEIVSACKDIAAVVGLPRINADFTEKRLFNSAAIIQDQKLIGFQDKSLLPTYDVFDERRYFEPSAHCAIWDILNKKVAVTICEDIWQHSALVKYTTYRRDPILDLKRLHPDIVLNLSASPYSVEKYKNRLKVCSTAASTLECPLVLCNQVGGDDSLIFDGKSLCVNAQGELIAQGRGFEEDCLFIDLEASHPPVFLQEDEMKDLYQALALGVRDYFHKLQFDRACLGLSGGIDSALVACIAAEALGRQTCWHHHALALFLRGKQKRRA